ncbi:MAG: glycosyltransferase family 2 protein [bacterium]|nr:glycosyltransferase family 2 protein [bacterium]
MKLSVVITAKNAAATLERTLKSVQFADEIVVVDMMSSDTTKQIALKFTDKVFFTPDVGYVEPARNFSLSKSSGDWILIVDADEVIPPALRDHLLQLLKVESDVSSYSIARKNIIFGEWVQTAGWWPDYQPRLFKRGKVLWSDTIHSKPTIDGTFEKLPATAELALEHHNYETLSEFVQRLDRYTSIATDVTTQKPGIDLEHPIVVFRREFLQRLFALRGIEGGYRGVLLALLQGFSEVVQTAKFWEVKQNNLFGAKTDSIKELHELRAQLAYWIADEELRSAQGLQVLVWRVRRKFRI